VTCAELGSIRQAVLQAGMCFHFQPGMSLDGFGAANWGPFVVTDNASKRLGHFARLAHHHRLNNRQSHLVLSF